jgi:hypothetical protein
MIAALVSACFGFSRHASPQSTPRRAAVPINQQIVGTWKLLSIYEEDSYGDEINQFGDESSGQFITDEEGNFSFQILSSSGRRYAAKAPSCVGSSGLIDAVTYFGTYSVNRQSAKLVLHVDNCLFRECDKTNRIITINFRDDTMEWVSSAEPSATGAFYNRMLWRRTCCHLHH